MSRPGCAGPCRASASGRADPQASLQGQARSLPQPRLQGSSFLARSLLREGFCSSWSVLSGATGARRRRHRRRRRVRARRGLGDARHRRDLDVLERSARRDVHLHRHELARVEPDHDRARLGGRGQAPERQRGCRDKRGNEQRVKEPDLHARSHCPPSGPSSGPLPARKVPPDAPTTARTLSSEFDVRNGEPLRAIRGGSFGVPITPPEGNQRQADGQLATWTGAMRQGARSQH